MVPDLGVDEQGYQQPRRVSSQQESITQPSAQPLLICKIAVVSWVRMPPSGINQAWAVMKMDQNKNKVVQTDFRNKKQNKTKITNKWDSGNQMNSL